MISVVLPIRLVSVANIREHWAKRAKRTKEQRNLADLALRRMTHEVWNGRELRTFAVTITRIAPRGLDGDNLQSACKGLRDGIADAMLVDDGDPRITWNYRQSSGRPKQYAVLIEIEVSH